MFRLLFLMLFLLLASQVGCSSLFNADKTISSAIGNYLPDPKGESDSGLEEQLRRVVDESTGQPIAPGQSAHQAVPEVESATSRTTETDSQTTSTPTSWDKIEQAVEADKRQALNVHTFTEPGQSPNSDQVESAKVKRKATQEELIRIYDKINSIDSRPQPYQPVPPLIQRPTIYPHSIVKPKFKPLASIGHQEPQSDISWKDSLEATIDHLQEELNTLDEGSAESIRLAKCLKILTSVDNDSEFVELVDRLEALQSTLPPHQFQAIEQLIASSGSNSNGQPSLMSNLQQAVETVAETAALDIKQAQLCTQIEGYGKFKTFTTNQFKPGDEVLLYCEIENFAQQGAIADSTKNGAPPVQTCAFDAQIEFLDQQNQSQFVRSFANITDRSSSDRRDFYLMFRFRIPKLKTGHHQLQIRIKDKIGNKSAVLDSPLQFQIADAN